MRLTERSRATHRELREREGSSPRPLDELLCNVGTGAAESAEVPTGGGGGATVVTPLVAETTDLPGVVMLVSALRRGELLLRVDGPREGGRVPVRADRARGVRPPPYTVRP